jgi:hypothetical protein
MFQERVAARSTWSTEAAAVMERCDELEFS